MNNSIKWRQLAKQELAKVRAWDVQAERTIQSYIDMLEGKLPIEELAAKNTEIERLQSKLDRLLDDMPTWGDELEGD